MTWLFQRLFVETQFIDHDDRYLPPHFVLGGLAGILLWCLICGQGYNLYQNLLRSQKQHIVLDNRGLMTNANPLDIPTYIWEISVNTLPSINERKPITPEGNNSLPINKDIFVRVNGNTAHLTTGRQTVNVKWENYKLQFAYVSIETPTESFNIVEPGNAVFVKVTENKIVAIGHSGQGFQVWIIFL